MRRKKLPKSTAIALIVGGDLVLLMLGWFMLVSPQRATAKSNATAVQATEVQIEQARAPVTRPTAATQPKQPEIRTAYLYKLSKAMPTTTDMPNLLLELTQVVRSAGVQLLADLSDGHRSHDRRDRDHALCLGRLLFADRSALPAAQPCRGTQRLTRRLRPAVLDHDRQPHAVGDWPHAQRERRSQCVHIWRCSSCGSRHCGAPPGGHKRYVDGRDHHIS